MDRKELIVILILGALVVLGATARLYHMPPGTLRNTRPPQPVRSSDQPSRKTRGRPVRALDSVYPKPRNDELPKGPDARSLFDAAERVFAEAELSIRERPLDKKLFDAAAVIYQQFLDEYEAKHTVEFVRFRIAQCLTRADRDAAAVAAYDSFLEAHPRSRFRQMALLWSGESHRKTGNRAQARHRFRQVIAEYPAAADGARRGLRRLEAEERARPDAKPQ